MVPILTRILSFSVSPKLLHTSFVKTRQIDGRPLAGLIQADGPISDEPVEVPWHIDNKYYTSDVTFRVLEVGYDDDVHAKDVPIVIYLFGKVLYPLFEE